MDYAVSHAAGMALSVAGFSSFRFFDILKPWPVNYFDRYLDGGLGIMMDDVAAGVYAFTVLQLTAFGVQLFL